MHLFGSVFKELFIISPNGNNLAGFAPKLTRSLADNYLGVIAPIESLEIKFMQVDHFNYFDLKFGRKGKNL